MSVTMKPFVTAVVVGAMMASMALAKVPLREVKEINDGLLAVGIADEIRKNCDSIAPRMFKALSYMNALESKAKAMGYTDAEIDAYVKSKEDKARMRAKGEAYLKANGVSRAEPETFCDLGRAEIAKGSQIGALLRAK